MTDSQATLAKDGTAAIDDELLAAYARKFTPGLIRNFMKRGAQEATAQDLAQDVFERLAKRVSGDALKKPSSLHHADRVERLDRSLAKTHCPPPWRP